MTLLYSTLYLYHTRVFFLKKKGIVISQLKELDEKLILIVMSYQQLYNWEILCIDNQTPVLSE